MSMEWFNRVTGELEDNLNSICEKYDQTGHMTIEQGAKHPRIEFFVESEESDRDYFCTLFYDPYNEEFYVESFDLSLEQPARIILSDIKDIVDAVHESFHDFMNDESEVFYVDDDDDYDDDLILSGDDDKDYDDDLILAEDDVEDEYYYGEVMDEEETIEEIDVEWETPEVTAFHIDDEIEVTYQFGVDNANGDGVLRRVNRLWTDDSELIEEESTLIFSKEEASTIIAMIASHMDTMTGYEGISNQ